VSTLAEIQDDFQKFILGDDAALESRIVGTARVPVATRLGIYGNAYVSRLIEALEASFPALAQLLGPEDFAALGEAYVRAQPSRFASIRYYGDTLAEFLAVHPDYESVPILSELARWEWTMADVFDAADHPTIASEDLQRFSPEDWAALRFEWHPSVRRLSLAWNAPQTWKALIANSERPVIEVHTEPVPWLLWRRDLQIRYRALPADEAVAADAVSAGKDFAQVCEQLCEIASESVAPMRAAAMLGEWVQTGLIAAVH
jgi:hypothetical protein